jgi:lipoprotein NlpD
VLSGCGGGRVAPVSDQSSALRAPESQYRIVVAGDTLYSIAWESAVDHKALARWNRIGPPYVIKPGQKLRLSPPRNTTSTKKPHTTTIKRATKPAKAPARVARASSKPAKKTSAPVVRANFGPWVWPADGKVLAGYAANAGNKGLDIGGRKGEPVRAAANGRVVYSGSGLRGYGQLIILKHNEEYLSAYAHNDKIYVKEGSMIKRGQQIAEMGSSGTDRVKLHFQIRRRGAPVDPLPYLPKK